jgi:hypothetical protein
VRVTAGSTKKTYAVYLPKGTRTVRVDAWDWISNTRTASKSVTVK